MFLHKAVNKRVDQFGSFVHGAMANIGQDHKVHNLVTELAEFASWLQRFKGILLAPDDKTWDSKQWDKVFRYRAHVITDECQKHVQGVGVFGRLLQHLNQLRVDGRLDMVRFFQNTTQRLFVLDLGEEELANRSDLEQVLQGWRHNVGYPAPFLHVEHAKGCVQLDQSAKAVGFGFVGINAGLQCRNCANRIRYQGDVFCPNYLIAKLANLL
mmetsp:Transcript_16537/g.28949  ORF Transcript_16537/g.28949 Transcript_16537/m.28949 type:complete len:212 (+) Transcript_16537:447-1082(+)